LSRAKSTRDAAAPRGAGQTSSRRGASGGEGGGRREEVIERAAALFDEGGYYATSMEDIAEAVGVRKPTLYHYFGSKDEILFWIHEEFIDLLISRQDRRIGTGMTPEQLVLEIMGDILELMETHRGHVRVFFEHHRELPEDEHAAIAAKRAQYESAVADVIRRGIDDGAFRDVDVKLATLALFGICNWSYQWYRSNGPLRPREIAYKFWDMFLNGVAARDT
jgi:AcrR family transcriptional regulator